MASTARIRTPLWRHLQQIRYRLVPVTVFALAVLATGWLWQRQAALPQATGEVQALRVDLASGLDGTLLAPAEGWPELLDEVRAGQVLARLDDREVQAQLRALRGELAQTESQVRATAAELQRDAARETYDRLTDLRRLALDVEQLELNLLDRQATLQTERIDLLRAQAELRATQAAFERGVETDYTLTTLRLVRDEAAERVEGLERALEQARQQLQTTRERLNEYSQTEQEQLAVDSVLAPLRQAIDVQRARVEELEVRAEGLVVRSPMSGRVCAVHRLPGQAVRAGDVVLSVAAGRSQTVVAYLREGQRLDVQPGMPVTVRPRLGRHPGVPAEVARVGSHIEPIPVHQLRTPEALEWGLPVTILLPPGNTLTPGELVDLNFRRAE